ncbi:MAG: hypothetical protein ABW185_13005 [Sedimenticola sp.]
MAVNQLCDGKPSEETVQFLKALERPLDVPAHQITRLYGTNFDAQYVNHEMLEEVDEELFVFKAKDEGNVYYIHASVLCRHTLLDHMVYTLLMSQSQNVAY